MPFTNILSCFSIIYCFACLPSTFDPKTSYGVLQSRLRDVVALSHNSESHYNQFNAASRVYSSGLCWYLILSKGNHLHSRQRVQHSANLISTRPISTLYGCHDEGLFEYFQHRYAGEYRTSILSPRKIILIQPIVSLIVCPHSGVYLDRTVKGSVVYMF